jgi:ABC-type polysaccharide/polyol phosphate export permease
VYVVQELAQIRWLLTNAVVIPGLLCYVGSRIVTTREQLIGWLAASMTLSLSMTAIAQAGFAVAVDRARGRLALVQCTQVSKPLYFLTIVVMPVLESLLIVVFGVGIFRALGWAEIEARQLPVLGVTSFAAGSALGALGAVAGLRTRDLQSGADVIATLSLAVAAVSPVFYSIDRLPVPLQWIAQLSPPTHLAAILRALMLGNAAPVSSILSTLVLAAVLGFCAYRMMRWHD